MEARAFMPLIRMLQSSRVRNGAAVAGTWEPFFQQGGEGQGSKNQVFIIM